MLPRPVVLAFHKLSPKFSFGATNFSPRRFDSLLHHIKSSGFAFVGPESSPCGVVVSFDDGYEDLVDVIPRLIDAWSIVPLVFMPTGLIGKPNRWDYSHYLRPCRHMDASAIRVLADLGVVFGTHGESHGDLTGLSVRDLRAELLRSRGTLEDITGKPVLSLSYPFGRTSERVVAAAREAGYRHGYTMTFPRPEDQPLLQGRVAVYGYDTPFSVRQKLVPGTLLYAVERHKAAVANRLSSGTTLLNRLRGYHADRG